MSAKVRTLEISFPPLHGLGILEKDTETLSIYTQEGLIGTAAIYQLMLCFLGKVNLLKTSL